MTANTFRAFVVWYLAIGMLLTGLSEGYHATKCPHDPVGEAVEVLTTILAYPTAFVGALAASGSKHDDYAPCKRSDPP